MRESGAPVRWRQVFSLAVHGNRSARMWPHGEEEDKTSLIRHACDGGEWRDDVLPSGVQPFPFTPCWKRSQSVKQLVTKLSLTVNPLAHLAAAKTVAFSFLLFSLALNFFFRLGPTVDAAVCSVLLLVSGAVLDV